MKITEVMQPSDRTLTEAIANDNTTGYLTEDLVQIARAAQGQWSEAVTADDIMADLE